MTSVAQPVRSAIVLAAGNGDRFHAATPGSKLRHPVLGHPILLRTLESAREAGIQTVTIVLGYEAPQLRALVESEGPRDLTIAFAYNPEWHLENGVSVLAARGHVPPGHFALLMGDHLFEPDVLRRMLHYPLHDNESVLAVDVRQLSPDVTAEATKVRRDGSRIVAIGKNLDGHDAVDTGMFVCAPLLFHALETARRAGDTTLSGGIRELADRGLMRALEIGNAAWCDIDTVADLTAAESVFSGGLCAAGPPCAVTRGGPSDSRSAQAARSLRSFARHLSTDPA